jgi:hypothetical protein
LVADARGRVVRRAIAAIDDRTKVIGLRIERRAIRGLPVAMLATEGLARSM